MRIRPYKAKMMLKPPVLIVNEASSMCIYPLMLMIKPGFFAASNPLISTVKR